MHKAENMLQVRGSLEERGGALGLPGGAETPLSQADQSVQVRKGPGKCSQLSVSIKTTWRAFEKGTPRTNWIKISVRWNPGISLCFFKIYWVILQYRRVKSHWASTVVYSTLGRPSWSDKPAAQIPPPLFLGNIQSLCGVLYLHIGQGVVLTQQDSHHLGAGQKCRIWGPAHTHWRESCFVTRAPGDFCVC